MLKNNKESRRDLRVTTSEPFIMKFQIQKHKKLVDLAPKQLVRAENISVGGMRLELPVLDEKEINRIISGQDKLVLELNIPPLQKPLKVNGKIIWLQKRDKKGKTAYVAGVTFEGLGEKEREEILDRLVNICLKSGCQIES
ncbi:MAG: PilZ domain-containing protein [Candidatus Omnitrophota bacterium]